MSQSLAQGVLAILRDFVAPLETAAKDAQARQALFANLGHTATVSSHPALLEVLQSAASLSDQLKSLDESSIDSWDGIEKLLALGKQLDAVYEGLRQLVNQPELAAAVEGLAEDMAGLLLASWLRRRHETIFSVLAFLTLIKLRETLPLNPGVVQGDVTLRNGYVLDQFEFSGISNVVEHPADVLLPWYLPNGMASGADAQLSADRLFPYLSRLADALGIAWEKRFTGGPATPPAAASPDDGLHGNGSESPEDGDGTLPAVAVPDSYYAGYFPTFSFVPFQNATTELRIDLRCSSLLHDGKSAGLVLGFSGDFNQTATQGQWKLTFSADGEIPVLLFSPTGIQLVPGDSALADGSVKLLIDSIPPEGSTGPAILFGSATGTRLEVSAVEFAIGATWTGTGGLSAAVGTSASGCSIVIAPGDGDGFLSSVLPANGLTAKFDLGVNWSNNTGFVFTGGAGLDVTLPVGVSIGGVIQIPTVHVGLAVAGTGLQSELSASIGLSIGPIQAVVDRIGILTALNFPSSGGAPSPSDLSFSFKPPSGVGLSVDTAGVSGGGFLSHDDAKHEYSGVLQLQFNDLALQAFGLITTQVAGGPGYSLLALIDAEFPPVQLGWGFTLNGVGGILAVHRTASTDALRAALKAGTLSSVLFPKNAITNAPLILAQLDTLFPTAAGRFLFGPMALIGWGSPTLLTISLAVILELPEPIRIVLLAVLSVRLPSESNALIRINMDALGVLDFSNDTLALDATLFDSKLLDFTLTGDMALRANWSTQREFLLAIGGFHPQFQPPADFPSLQRITINMPSGAVSKLRLAAYLAVTSNTVQFGAALDVFIGVSEFGLSGHLGFDALLALDPFHFDADISGSVSLTAGGDDLMSVGLDADLSGPAPWQISGKFKIHLFFFDVHKSFSHTWGQDAPSQQVDTVDVLPLLTAALADSRNWGAQLPAGTPPLVSLRTADQSALIAHPLARLEVHESLVPLDLAIEKFGSASPSGTTTFTIGDYLINGSSVPRETVQDDFAPAQFFNLSDDDKLARPSFERFDAGTRYAGGLVASGTSVTKTITYETFYVDEPGGELRIDEGEQPQPILMTAIEAILLTGAAGNAQIWRSGNRRYSAPGTPISVAQPLFAVAENSSLAAAGVGPDKGTYSTVQASLAAELGSNPGRRRSLEIVSVHELVAP